MAAVVVRGADPNGRDRAPTNTINQQLANNTNNQNKVKEPAGNNEEVFIEQTETGFNISKLSDSAPFNNFPQRKTYSSSTVLVDMQIGSPKVLSTYLTTTNPYFIGSPDGKISPRPYYVQSVIKYDVESRPYRNNWLWKNTPSSSVLPNCVGFARGRAQELLKINKSIGSASGGGMRSLSCFASPPGQSDPEAEKYKKQLGGNITLGIDRSGSYGVKNGIWGRGFVSKGAPPIPGSLICWTRPGQPGHVAFIEALYNYGKSNEYIICSEFWYGNYTARVGYGRVYKITKTGHGSLGNYGYGTKYADACVCYTPLCNFNGVSGMLTLEYAKPPVQQIEAYNTLTSYIQNGSASLKIGSKVQIQGYGWSKSSGSGQKINCILGVGYITKIEDAGILYPYRISNKPSGGKVIGYYNRQGIKRL